MGQALYNSVADPLAAGWVWVCTILVQVYLHLRLEAQRRRQKRDVQQEYVQGLHELECSRQCADIRDRWAAWNPQREAMKQLQDAIAAGMLTLQVGRLSQPVRLAVQTAIPSDLNSGSTDVLA